MHRRNGKLEDFTKANSAQLLAENNEELGRLEEAVDHRTRAVGIA